MKYAIFNVGLYTKDYIEDWGQCPWRKYMRTLTNVDWVDLNYNSANLEDVVAPLNTWIDADEEPFTPDSFPFVLYQKLNTANTRCQPKLVVIRTLEELYNDKILSEYVKSE